MAHGRVDQTAKSFTLEGLPTELLLNICNRLIPEDILLIFALVNKQFAEITDSDDLWHGKVKLHFSHAAQKLEARVNNTIDEDGPDSDSDDKSDSEFIANIDLSNDKKWLHLYKQQWLKRIKCLDPANDPNESDDDVDPIPHVGRLFSIMTEGDYELFLKLPRYEHTVFFEKDHKDRSCSDLVIQSGSQQLLNHLYANYKEAAKYQKDYNSHRFYVPYTQATFSCRNLRYDDGKTLLYFAIAYGKSLEEIKCLMQDGSKFDEKWTKSKQLQPIHLAAKFGRIDVIDYLITDYPVTLEDEDKLQRTPLHYAVKHNQIKMVEFLIAKKVNLEHKDNEEKNVLMHALEQENFPLMLTLLKAGADFSVDYSHNFEFEIGELELDGALLTLHLLASLDTHEYIDKILEMKPELLKLKVGGLTVLDNAIALGNLRSVKYFFNRKVSFDEKSLLQAAAEAEDIDEANNVFNYLNEYDPTLLEQFDFEGNTCLHIAVANKNWKTAKIIAQLKPDLATRRNNAGKTPLLFAAGQGTLINLLESCPLFSNYLEQVTAENDTVLHIAMSQGYMKTVKKVLELKPELINSKNKNGQSPLQLLQPLHFSELFKLLRDNNRLDYLNEEHYLFIFTSILASPVSDNFLREMAQELFVAYPQFLIEALKVDNPNIRKAFSWLFEAAKANEQLCSLLLMDGPIITDERLISEAFRGACDKWSIERSSEAASSLIALLKKYHQLPQFSYMSTRVLHKALECSEYDILKNMIEENILTLEEKNENNSTLLLRAIKKWNSSRYSEGEVQQQKAMEFIQWLIKKGANFHAADDYGDTPYSYCSRSPLSQAKIFGANFSLIDQDDLQILKDDDMRSPLMVAIRQDQNLSVLIDAMVLDDQKKQMIECFANYLQDRYDDSRDYITKMFCTFSVGCSRLEKIHASLAAINAIVKGQDLQELMNDRRYHRALTNGRLGKIVANCVENNKPAPQPAPQALRV